MSKIQSSLKKRQADKVDFKTIVIAGGGTGGHFFPGLAVAFAFKKRHPQIKIIFVGSTRGIEQKEIQKTPFSLVTLKVVGFYRVGIFKKIISLFLLPVAILRSIYWLLLWKPDFILGVGGYVSGPFLLACLFLRKIFFIQEQNAYAGMTNRFLGKYAAISFLVYPDKYNFFKFSSVVGNPIRPEIDELWKNNQKQPKSKFQITILGGSQGSSFINNLLIASLPLLKSFSSKIKIIHQSGKLDYEILNQEYKKNNIECYVKVFFDDMPQLYKTTDLFICRAGAGIFELTAAGRIGILIPITNSSGDHQRRNAIQLKQNAGFFVLEEQEATAAKLYGLIKNILNNQKKLSKLENLSSHYYQGSAAKKIYSQISNYFKSL